MRRTSKKWDSLAIQELDERRFFRLGGGRYDHFVNSGDPESPLDDVMDDWVLSEWTHDLSREPARSHAGLDDRNDPHLQDL
jgi:hypothetical protein